MFQLVYALHTRKKSFELQHNGYIYYTKQIWVVVRSGGIDISPKTKYFCITLYPQTSLLYYGVVITIKYIRQPRYIYLRFILFLIIVIIVICWKSGDKKKKKIKANSITYYYAAVYAHKLTLIIYVFMYRTIYGNIIIVIHYYT